MRALCHYCSATVDNQEYNPFVGEKMRLLMLKLYKIFFLIPFFIFSFSSPVLAENIGPLASGEVGDTVSMQAIVTPPSAEMVNSLIQEYQDMSEEERNSTFYGPFDTIEDKILFAIYSYYSFDRLEGTSIARSPLWLTTLDQEMTLISAYTRGYAAVKELTDLLNFDSLREIFLKSIAYENENYSEMVSGTHKYLSNGGWGYEAFPKNGTFDEKLEWSVDVHWLEWNALRDHVSAEEKLFIYASSAALLTKNHYENEVVLQLPREEIITSSGEQRVFSYKFFNGGEPKPLVLFLHGSFGGFVPEQETSYVELANELSNRGYHVVLPVGSPQNRSDYKNTGMGMLNWDPVGTEKDGLNSKYILELIEHLKVTRNIDDAKIFLVGHSQGGFFISNLIAHYPGQFKAVAMLGAGGGSYHKTLSSTAVKTPVMLLTGRDDPHLPYTQSYYDFLLSIGYDISNLIFFTPEQRGHLLIPMYDANKIDSFFKRYIN